MKKIILIIALCSLSSCAKQAWHKDGIIANDQAFYETLNKCKMQSIEAVPYHNQGVNINNNIHIGQENKGAFGMDTSAGDRAYEAARQRSLQNEIQNTRDSLYMNCMQAQSYYLQEDK